jgi:hypothetical protein
VTRHRLRVIFERRLGLGILRPPRPRVVQGAGYWHVYHAHRQWSGEATDHASAIELAGFEPD